MGVRGFSLPGDYDSHILFMVNGHNMADNIFDYMLFFGNEFPIDMNLIKQIEIIRGPGSALYGSNAMFATINIVTKAPDEAGPLTTADTGSFGEKKGQIVAAASSAASKFYSPDRCTTTPAKVRYFFRSSTLRKPTTEKRSYDRRKGLSFLLDSGLAELDRHSRIRRGQIRFSRYPGAHDLQRPGTQFNDQRNFIDAAYERKIAGGTLRWRTYYDSFHYGRAAATTRWATAPWKITGKARSAIGWGPSSPTASVPSSPETSPWVSRVTLTRETS
jgi:outer membrane receptor for ferrienterochelin and colicins